MSLPCTAAACSIGASNACAREVQCDRSVVPVPTLVVNARAISRAPSHEPESRTGDHRSAYSPPWVVPVGSNIQNLPSTARVSRVACTTSIFVDVDTTAPLWERIAGMITLLVFPDLGGPSSNTARSDRENRGCAFSSRPR